MNIPLKRWGNGDHITAADLNRITEAIRRATPIRGPGISITQSLGGSVISLSRRAGAGGRSAQADEDFPFRIRRVNSGTAQSPSWHTIVYVPDYAISGRFPLAPSGMDKYDTANYPDWYEFTNTIGGLGPACLQVRVVNAGGVTSCYWRLGGLTPEAGWPGGEGVTTLRTYVLPLGVVSGGGTGEAGAGDIAQLVSSAIYVAADFVGSGGGGGGSLVAVEDERSDATKPGVVGYGGTDQQGVITLIAKDGVGAELVLFLAGTTLYGTLVDYLAGRIDFEDDATFGGLGKNVNTETFAEDCLGPAETPDVGDESADPDKAAPSAHTHTLGQFTNGDGTELDAQSIIDWFSNVGMWDALGETGPSGEPSENSLLTIGDIEDDPTYFKPDSATPSAGSVTTDLLALSGHRHPLNVADISAATGPTGETPTPPPAGDFVQPVGVGTTGPSGEASPTTAMHGSSPYYARVDHVHPICEEMGPTGPGYVGIVGPSGGIDKSMADGSGDFGGTGQTLPTGVTLDTNVWLPGESGYVESYCTRIVKVEDEFGVTTRYAIFRRRKVSRTGQVVWVGPEYAGFVLART